MAVDDIATDPVRIAREIHRQLGVIEPPVPVDEIARALDIEHIVASAIRGYEGLLITDAERDRGVIQVNSSSSPQRRRFSVGHELGHFLCGWHKPVYENGFRCTRADMASPAGDDTHSMQEREANAFSIELLAPAYLVDPHLKRLPDIERILDLQQRLNISKAAAARRYARLHAQPIAIVFAQHSRFLYAERSSSCPYLTLTRSELLPAIPTSGTDKISDMVRMDSGDWFRSHRTNEMSAQVLSQQDGYAMILLTLDEVAP